mmetsp:Transcript_38477/g.114193  ORF Transcript_38477/g.114193 Transcript_38477/m.114193 type:complete len:309 (-) Transcript_38477:452-1378(-)
MVWMTFQGPDSISVRNWDAIVAPMMPPRKVLKNENCHIQRAMSRSVWLRLKFLPENLSSPSMHSGSTTPCHSTTSSGGSHPVMNFPRNSENTPPSSQYQPHPAGCPGSTICTKPGAQPRELYSTSPVSGSWHFFSGHSASSSCISAAENIDTGNDTSSASSAVTSQPRHSRWRYESHSADHCTSSGPGAGTTRNSRLSSPCTSDCAATAAASCVLKKTNHDGVAPDARASLRASLISSCSSVICLRRCRSESTFSPRQPQQPGFMRGRLPVVLYCASARSYCHIIRSSLRSSASTRLCLSTGMARSKS